MTRLAIVFLLCFVEVAFAQRTQSGRARPLEPAIGILGTRPQNGLASSYLQEQEKIALMEWIHQALRDWKPSIYELLPSSYRNFSTQEKIEYLRERPVSAGVLEESAKIDPEEVRVLPEIPRQAITNTLRTAFICLETMRADHLQNFVVLFSQLNTLGYMTEQRVRGVFSDSNFDLDAWSVRQIRCE